MQKKLHEVCVTLTHPKLVAPTAFQLVFCKNAASKLHPVFVNYSIIRWTLVRSHLNGNMPMLHLSTRKIVKNQQKIIDLLYLFASHPWKSSGTWRVFQILWSCQTSHHQIPTWLPQTTFMCHSAPICSSYYRTISRQEHPNRHRLPTGGKFVWAFASKMSHAIAWNTRNACLQKGAFV
jgi:hypothetical protein